MASRITNYFRQSSTPSPPPPPSITITTANPTIAVNTNRVVADNGREESKTITAFADAPIVVIEQRDGSKGQHASTSAQTPSVLSMEEEGCRDRDRSGGQRLRS